MLLRAIFWIGVVSVLMPHEPDLGLGRPQIGMSGAIASATADATPERDCLKGEMACAGSLFMASVHNATVRSLADVKADLAANAPQAGFDIHLDRGKLNTLQEKLSQAATQRPGTAEDRVTLPAFLHL